MNMKSILIIPFLILFSLLSADISTVVSQDGTEITLSLTTSNGGGLIELDTCATTLWSGIVLTDTTFTITRPSCCSITIRWTPIRTESSIEAFSVGENVMRIPGGWFNIGATAENQQLLTYNFDAPPEFIYACTPNKWVFIDTFDIMTVEVPCSIYSQFIADGGYDDSVYWILKDDELSDTPDPLAGWELKDSLFWEHPGVLCDDYAIPVRGVSYYEATAFAHWKNNGHLPTEAQWEVAARLSNRAIFPWGDTFCPSEYDITANIIDENQCNSDPFDGRPGYPEFFEGDISPAGCMAMGGNLSEWCLDVYSSAYYTSVSMVEPVLRGSETGTKAIRGGSYLSDNRYRASALRRFPFEPAARDGHIGFRVAWDRANGEPDEWYSESFTLDCTNPEVLGVFNPYDCLIPHRADSFAVIFTEAVQGDVYITPNDPINLLHRFSSEPGETLWVIKSQYVDYDEICIHLSDLTDTAGNPLSSPESICTQMCEQYLNIYQHPETLWSPQGCANQGEVTLTNLSDYPLLIDSIVTYPPFEILGVATTIDADDSASLILQFTPDYSGAATVPILVFTEGLIFTDSLLGFACLQPLVSASPTFLDFGEECDSIFLELGMSIVNCPMGVLKISDISLAKGIAFESVKLGIDDTLDTNGITDSIKFTPPEQGTYYDTLIYSFLPLQGVCYQALSMRVPLYGVCTDEPTTDYDAVGENDIVTFLYIEKNVMIFDHRGRFVIELEPNSNGEAEWKLFDDNLSPVPAGVYFWKSGRYSGTIIVVR